MTSAIAVAALVLLSTLATPAPATTATIDVGRRHQQIDGFGFSEAFGRAEIMHGSQGLSAPKQREILDLLLSRTSGAGLSILRLGIGSTSANSIQPTDPGGPNAVPRYVWDRDDESQVWLAQQAKAYGVKRLPDHATLMRGAFPTSGSGELRSSRTQACLSGQCAANCRFVAWVTSGLTGRGFTTRRSP